MQAISTTLQLWSWAFLILYVGAMLYLGYVAQRRVTNADQFATARGSYGPLFLAFAFAATTASGATFIGIPGIGYHYGLSVIWVAFLYPIGVFLGMGLCMRAIARGGAQLGSRSIPEYLGQRYRSEALRIVISVFSLLLFFYIAGQLVSCLVMFASMLGAEPFWALVITCGVLFLYVAAGGAHADILTDGVQGMLMLALGVAVLILFVTGYSVTGGLDGLLARLSAQDPLLLSWMRPDHSLTNSVWALSCLILATIPMGLMPHLGNKLWAIREQGALRQFLSAGFVIAMLIPAVGLGGVLARAILGDDLLASGFGSNMAIPALFLHLFPDWVAALLGMGVLAAVMSTADGLIISSSQVLANDLYRCSFAPRFHGAKTESEIDRLTLQISRFGTFLALLVSAILAWLFKDMNVLLLVWIGLGGMMAALAGPLILGSLWRGMTPAAAMTSFVVGGGWFIALHSGLLGQSDDAIRSGNAVAVLWQWVINQQPNPYACATLGGLMGMLTALLVSANTKKLPEEHLNLVFSSSERPTQRTTG
jgi:Na+/proline symporter